jgi:hypothetical protein
LHPLEETLIMEEVSTGGEAMAVEEGFHADGADVFLRFFGFGEDFVDGLGEYLVGVVPAD